MRLSLDPRDVAALFAMIGLPSPPLVVAALGERGWDEADLALNVTEPTLLDQGLLVTASSEEPVVLRDDAAELLAVCRDAASAVTLERDGVIGDTAYFVAGRATVVSGDGDAVTLSALEGDEDVTAWMAASLGEAVVDEDGSSFGFPLPADDLESLLDHATRAGGGELDAFCRERAWPRSVFEPHLRIATSRVPRIKVTAIRSDTEGLATTSLASSPHGAWCVKIVLSEGHAAAKLAWRPLTGLLGFVCDFEDDVKA